VLGQRYISFGAFELDQEFRTVTRSGSRCKIGGKNYELLVALLEKPFEIVSREELGSRLWPGTTVRDCNAKINVAVSQLRQVLRNSGDARDYFQTIPQKGYVFVVALQGSDQPSTPLVIECQGPDEPPTALELHPPKVEDSRNAAPKQVQQVSSLPLAEIGAAIGIVGLFLISVLLGAGITRLWISH